MDESKVTMKGRLGPGMMIAVDLLSGQVCREAHFTVPNNAGLLPSISK